MTERSTMIRRLKSDRGAAAVEFGIILLALIPLVIGVLEMGKGLSTYITLTSAAREGARSMVISNNTTTAKTSAENAAYGLSPALADANITFPSIGTCTGNAGGSMQVRVTYSAPSLTNLIFTSIPMNVTGAMRCPG
jgi:Flp pilus assembly protein TadG